MIWWSLLRMLEATRTISRDYLYTDEYIDRVVLLLCDDDVSNLTKISWDPEFYIVSQRSSCHTIYEKVVVEVHIITFLKGITSGSTQVTTITSQDTTPRLWVVGNTGLHWLGPVLILVGEGRSRSDDVRRKQRYLMNAMAPPWPLGCWPWGLVPMLWSVFYWRLYLQQVP